MLPESPHEHDDDIIIFNAVRESVTRATCAHNAEHYEGYKGPLKLDIPSFILYPIWSYLHSMVATESHSHTSKLQSAGLPVPTRAVACTQPRHSNFKNCVRHYYSHCRSDYDSDCHNPIKVYITRVYSNAFIAISLTGRLCNSMKQNACL